MKGGSRKAAPYLILAAATAALFWKLLLLGHHYVPADFLRRLPFWYRADANIHNVDLFDAIIFYYPQATLVKQSWMAGHLPLWNPYNFCGQPLLADSQAGPLYPVRALLLRWLDVPLALDLYQMLHVYLAGVAMYLFMRKRRAAPFGATVAAMAWMLGGPSMAWMEFLFGASVGVQMPLTLWLLADAHEGRRASYTWAGVAVGMGLWTGFSPFALFVWMVAALYAAWLLREKWLQTADRREVGADGLGLLGAAAVAGLVAAAQLLPTMRLVAASERPIFSLAYLTASYRQFLVGFAPTMIFPDLFGNPADGLALKRIFTGGRFVFSELHAYVGVLPLFLAALAAGRRRRGDVPFFLGLALAVLLIPATPLYDVFYATNPVLRRLVPTRMILVVSFGIAVLAGYGADLLAARRVPLRWMAGAAAALGLGWAAALAWLHGWLAEPGHLGPAMQLLMRGWLRVPDREFYLTDAAFLNDVARHVMDYPTLVSSWKPVAWLAGTAAVALCAGQRRAVPDHAVRGMALLLIAADLVSWGSHFNTAVPRSAIYPPAPVLTWIRGHGGGERWRVLGIRSVKPDTTTPARVMDVGGYDALYPRVAAAFLSAAENSAAASLSHPYTNQVFPITNADSRLWNLLAARWVVAYPNVRLDPRRFRLRYQHDLLGVYENVDALPRAWLVARAEVAPAATPTEVGLLLTRLASPSFHPRQEVLLQKPWTKPGTPTNSMPALAPPGGPRTLPPRKLGTPTNSKGAPPPPAGRRPQRPPELVGVPNFRAGSPPSRGLERDHRLELVGVPNFRRAGLDRVVIDVDAPQAGWLVLADTWDPGWTATVDGTPVPVYQANYVERAVAVPGGRHTVEMRYRPRSVARGLLLSGIGLVAAGGWLVAALWLGRRDRLHPSARRPQR